MNTPGRNDPCTCGSGKKFKHCCLNRKPVSVVAGIEWESPQAMEGVRIEPDGKITFIPRDKNARAKQAWVSTHRERSKGEKTLFKIGADPSDLRINEAHALRKFNFVFAIDTNNRQIRENLISISHITQMRFKNEVEIEAAPIGAFEFSNVSERQENLGWWLLQDEILRSSDHHSDNTYAIITDSDLGNHEAYNKREKPIYGDYLLAPNFTLHYASEEGRGIANGLIKDCDRESTITLNEIESGKLPSDGLVPSQGTPFTHLRRIFNNNGEFAKQGWFNLLRPLDN